jgi:hypothetical protein
LYSDVLVRSHTHTHAHTHTTRHTTLRRKQPALRVHALTIQARHVRGSHVHRDPGHHLRLAGPCPSSFAQQQSRPKRGPPSLPSPPVSRAEGLATRQIAKSIPKRPAQSFFLCDEPLHIFPDHREEFRRGAHLHLFGSDIADSYLASLRCSHDFTWVLQHTLSPLPP